MTPSEIAIEIVERLKRDGYVEVADGEFIAYGREIERVAATEGFDVGVLGDEIFPDELQPLAADMLYWFDHGYVQKYWDPGEVVPVVRIPWVNRHSDICSEKSLSLFAQQVISYNYRILEGRI